MQLGKHHLSMAVLALLTLTAPSLKAAADLKFGMQFGLAVPTGDLKDFVVTSSGVNLGFFMQADLKQGHVIRGRLDLASYNGNSVNQGFITIDRNFNSLSLGADYLYFMEGAPKHGFYALGGAGISNNNLALTVTQLLRTDKVSVTKAAPYFNLGAGYQFNQRWAAEVRYNTTKLTIDSLSVNGSKLVIPGLNLDFTCNSILLNATLRF